MIIKTIEEIEVEKCLQCKGVFLDGGELDKIRERLKQHGFGSGWGLGFVTGMSAA
jgi:Zn-finger nucleic acid-binding protein